MTLNWKGPMRRLLTAVFALVLLHGCSKPKADQPEPDTGGARSYVEVTNHFGLPVQIFVAGGGSVQRLGTVHPNMSAHFVIPRNFSNGGSSEFRADAGPGQIVYRSAQMLVQPGAIIDMEIASVMFNSTTVIRP